MPRRKVSHPAQGSIVERADWAEQISRILRKEEHSGRILVCVTSYRRKLLDRGNLCAKYFIDAARYAGFLRDDTESEIVEIVRQYKVVLESEERTEIEIVYPPDYRDKKSLF